MRTKIYGLQIDALRLCYEVTEPYHIDKLKDVKVDGVYEFYEFFLERIEGKHFDYVYQIKYPEPDGIKLFGELRLGLNQNKKESNEHLNGLTKAWINISNRVLYSDEIYYLDYIADSIGLQLHNITTLDVCLDLSNDIARLLKKLIRDKNVTTFLNRKQIKNRKDYRPEIKSEASGDMDRDKYLTLYIKQKKAIKDKSRGATLIAYNKKAEIKNSSKKEYISKLYGDPHKLYRLEIHLNNDEVKDYVKQYIRDPHFDPHFFIWDKKYLWKVFGYYLNSIIYFKKGQRVIEWADILAGDITTTPAKTAIKKVNYSKANI